MHRRRPHRGAARDRARRALTSGGPAPEGTEPARELVLLHGFLRTGASMALLGVRLKALGYRAVHLPTFGYHLRPIESHGVALRTRLSTLAERREVTFDFVTFSFGGVLLRAALGDPVDGGEGRGFRTGRVVMLSPPNQGALLAEQVRGLLPVHLLGWDPLRPLLPANALPAGTPAAEVGILTGGTGGAVGFNRALPGDNDGKVRVDEAWLHGVSAFKIIPQRHFQMPFSDAAFRETRAFLETGRFLAG